MSLAVCSHLLIRSEMFELCSYNEEFCGNILNSRFGSENLLLSDNSLGLRGTNSGIGFRVPLSTPRVFEAAADFVAICGADKL